MFRFEPLLRFPKIYAALALSRNNPNFEKILYLREIKPGDTVFDLGANIGYYTCLFSKLAGPSGEVSAFEPVPIGFQKLCENTKDCKNTRLNNFAVGKKTQDAEIFYDPKDLGKSSLFPESLVSKKTEKTKVITLDDYCNTNNLKRLDFVKCDIEGYELHAMPGMSQALRDFLPQLSIEVTLPAKERLELIELLKEIGYDTFRRIDRNFPLLSLDRDIYSDDFFYLNAFSSKTPSSLS